MILLSKHERVVIHMIELNLTLMDLIEEYGTHLKVSGYAISMALQLNNIIHPHKEPKYVDGTPNH